MLGPQPLPASLPFAAADERQSVSSLQSVRSTPYMSIFKIQASRSDPTPFVVYPLDSKTAWLVAVKFGPFLSQVINFTLDAPPRVVLNTTASLASVLVDAQGRVWFAGDGAGLGYYDPGTGKVQNVTSLQEEYSWFIAADATDRVWVTLGSNKIAMYDSASNKTVTYPVPTPNAVLQGITVAPDGMIWFAGAGSKKLARLDPSTSNITEYSSPLKLVAPTHVAVDNTGTVWFTDHGTNEFGSFNPQTGEWRKFPIGYCPGTSCFYGLPNAIALDRNGKVWFSEHLPGRIARYDPDSGVLTEYIIPIPPGSPGTTFAYAWWAWPGPDNLVWFTAFGLGEIGYVNSTVPVPFTLSAQGQLTIPKGAASSFSVTLNAQGRRTLSVGVSASTPDQNLGGNPYVSGSFLQSVPVDGASQVGVQLSASWDAPVGSRFVMITASDGQVSVSVPVKVNIVESTLPYLITIAAVIGGVLAAVVLYVRRRRKRLAGAPTLGAPSEPATHMQRTTRIPLKLESTPLLYV